MTVPVQTPYNSYTYAGSATFVYGFQIILATDLQVSVAGVVQPPANYTISGVGNQTGGSINYTGTLTTGQLVELQRVTVLKRANDYQDEGDFLAATINADFDRLWQALQEQQRSQVQAIRVPEASGVAVLPAAANRLGTLLGFDAVTGALTLVAGAVGSALALAAQYASSLGASLIGSLDAGNYFNGTTVEAILQEIGNTKGQLQLDGVNVLRYIPPAEWPAIIAKTSTTNLYAYLQAALTAEPNLLFPDGLFNTGTKLIPRVDAKIRGMRRRGTLLKGTAANTILEFPITTFDPVVQNIRFQGAGCTGIAVAATAGTLHDYLIRPFISECDFDYDLAYGINADMIFARIEKNTFGYYGVGTQPAPGASTFVAIRSYGVTSGTANNTNLNTLRNNIFQNAGSLAQAAVDISSGSSWLFDSNDFEQGGMVLSASNIQLLRFTGTNWLEANVATNALISIGACTSAAIFEGLQISNNTCDRLFQAPLDGTCKGLVIRNNSISLNSPSYMLFDTISLSRFLPGNGSVAFYENNVSGGNAANKLVSGTEFRGGLTSPRLTLSGVTTTPGTISSSSDPGATISYNGVGDVSITASNPFATSTAKLVAVMTPQVGFQARVLVISTTQIRVQIQTPAGASVDGAFGLVVYGS